MAPTTSNTQSNGQGDGRARPASAERPQAPTEEHAQTARDEGARTSSDERAQAERDQHVQAGREEHAQAARRKVAERRDRQSGAAAWIADRAGQWSLDGPDWNFMEAQKYFWNPLMDYWFRMEIEGWEHIPEPPALLVGVHAGAPFVWDAWTIGAQWWRHFGEERPLHGTAHDALMALPLVGGYFRKMGVLPAAPDSISAALAAGHDVALWPGGERDALRPWTKRDQAILAGRTGFVRLAIRSGVPIVPIATVGGSDAMPVVATGRRLAKLLRVDKLARLKMLPVALQAPWGPSLALLPEIPFPTKIRTAFQRPVELDSDPDRADDEQYVEAKYDEVLGSIQDGMKALARRRAFPLFG
jgi:1-acyl-sn-glycerol-3-phosphate acyltransferase